MKTAEVAIEHVLSGLLALCAFMLPFLGSSALPSWASLTGSAVVGVLGLAYLVGVVFDKLADTVLSPLEQSVRLSVAKSSKLKNEDPFPQDALEYALRGEGGARVEWMDSLRSRIRTCRGLAVLGAPASVGVASMMDTTAVNQPSLVAILTLSALAVAIVLSHSKRLKLRRTNCPPPEKKKDKRRELGRLSVRLLPLVVPFTLSGLYAVAQWRAGDGPPYPAAGVVAVGGLCLSVLALWTWWRITKTHMDFVLQAAYEKPLDGL